MPHGWAKARNDSGVTFFVKCVCALTSCLTFIYVYIFRSFSHKSHETQWKDPRLSNAIIELRLRTWNRTRNQPIYHHSGRYDYIQYSCYRAAMKLRDLQSFTRCMWHHSLLASSLCKNITSSVHHTTLDNREHALPDGAEREGRRMLQCSL